LRVNKIFALAPKYERVSPLLLKSLLKPPSLNPNPLIKNDAL
jgi:hypothetical protein